MIHPACSAIFKEVIKEIRVRGEMDRSTFQVMETSGRDWDFVRRSIDPAVSDQNIRVLQLMADLKLCECPLYKEEAEAK